MPFRLSGSEGKLTLPAQKMDIISIIGGHAQCAVSSGQTRAELVGDVLSQLSTVLQVCPAICVSRSAILYALRF